MSKRNVLIIGAGGVAHVAAHKAAMHNDELGDICIASRTLSKCEAIVDSVVAKGHLRDPSRRLHARQLDALDVGATVAAIKETGSQIVVNLGTAFVNMAVLEACLETGAAYLDTAIHEEPDAVCEDPPWYANHEWKRAQRCADRGVTAILGAGFDPGVVNAYCRARRQGAVRRDRHDRHPRRQRRPPRPLLRHELRPGDQLPRVRQGVDVDRPAVGRVPDAHRPAGVRLPGRRPAARVPQRPRRAALAVASTSTPTASASGWASATTTSTCSPCCARSGCCRTSRSGRRRRRRAAAGRQGRAPRPADARPRLHRQDVHRQHRHRSEGRPPPRGVHLPGAATTPRPTTRSGSQAISYTAGVPPIAAARLIASGEWDAGPHGERRGARPGAVPRPARPDGPADRGARDRPGTAPAASTARSARWRPRSPTPSSP